MTKKEMAPEVGAKKTLFNRFLTGLERAGNKLPDPLMIFVFLSAAAIVLSGIASAMGLSAVHPVTGETLNTVNLFSIAGLLRFLSSAVTNFTGFAPMGVVLVTVLGVGFAEKTGFYHALLTKTMSGIKHKLFVIVAVVFISVNANALADAGFIVMPPLSAMLFAAVGLNPLAGMLASYASIAGGFSANLSVSMLDMLLVGFTQAAAQLVDPEIVLNPAMNFYFLAVSTIMITIVGTWVTAKIVIPRMGHLEHNEEGMKEITALESKGLKYAGIATLIFIALVLVGSIPSNGILREVETGSLISMKAPLMSGMVPLITLLFFIPGYTFAKVSGKIKSGKDIAAMMGQAMSEMGPYIVLAFVIAQFLAFFNWSNLGIIFAIKGAEFLKGIGAPTPVLLVLFIVLAGIINLFIGSASAKWALLSPIFVPMFMLLGFHPALTQVTYRIGDSITNVITPLLPYFTILLAFARKYDKNIGMGTLIANMIPYTIFFFIAWVILLIVWLFLGLPLGPGGTIFL